MYAIDLISWRHLEYEPPGLCHDFGIGEGLAAVGAAASSAVGSVGSALGLGTAAAIPAVAETGALAEATGAAGLAATAGPAVLAAAGPDALAATAATTAAGSSIGLPSLGTIGAVAGGVGSLIQAKAGLNQAQYQSEIQTADAQALTQKADQDAAAGEQTAIARQRTTQLALSRGQAFAAASGGGATDPTVLDVEEQTAGQGTYNALSGLYQGQAAARSDTQQAGIDLFNAQNIQNAAPLAATGTILSGLSSFVNNRARLNLNYSANG